LAEDPLDGFHIDRLAQADHVDPGLIWLRRWSAETVPLQEGVEIVGLGAGDRQAVDTTRVYEIRLVARVLVHWMPFVKSGTLSRLDLPRREGCDFHARIKRNRSQRQPVRRQGRPGLAELIQSDLV
jgi:hypothetical protein